MKTIKQILITLWVVALSALLGHTQLKAQNVSGEKLFPEQIAPLLEGMGKHGFAISSKIEMARTYFNQGMGLTYGFNHLEAGRSFQQVIELDPQAAIAYWGQALVLGRNINSAMEASAVKPAYEAIQKAVELKRYASEFERDLIDALAKRYSDDESMKDRERLDMEYAEAMRRVANKYKADPNVQTLYASSLMNLHPWDFWNGDGTPKVWTPEILEVLEDGLAKHPTHSGLIHYYIHAVEASKNPGRALKSADILADLMPGSGHIVHMPSHIYIRTGKYHEGVLINERAMQVDDNYITQCRQQGIYPLAYVPHNRHFLWSMATLEGSSSKAIKAAEHMAGHIDEQLMRSQELSTLQHYWVTPLYAYVRFGKWNKILETPKPDSDLLYPLGVWHYARGVAFTAQGKFQEAEKEYNTLRELSGNDTLKGITVWEINDAFHVLQIATYALEGELKAKQGKTGDAVQAFQKAINLEDNLNYNEPSDWHYPIRQSLGAVLLEAGYAKEAEAVYRADLEVFPENGWSLFGLHKSLIEQGRTQEAITVKERLDKAWKWADFKLKASRVL